MVAWFTLFAAVVAAVGSIVGPLVAYRTAIRTIEARSLEAAAARRQASVDRAVDLAVGDNAKGAEVGIRMLDRLADTGGLTDDQTSAVYSALDTTVGEPEAVTDNLDSTSDTGDKEVDP